MIILHDLCTGVMARLKKLFKWALAGCAVSTAALAYKSDLFTTDIASTGIIRFGRAAIAVID